MVNYASAKATATRLISENGRTVNIIAKGVNNGDEFNPDYGPEVVTPVTAVFTKFKTSEIDGTIIRSTDIMLLVDADEIQSAIDRGGPIEAQRVEDGDTAYSIVAVPEIKPGPLSILSKVQCRT